MENNGVHWFGMLGTILSFVLAHAVGNSIFMCFLKSMTFGWLYVVYWVCEYLNISSMIL